MARSRPHRRALLLLPAAVSMLSGLIVSLSLLGLDWAPVRGRLDEVHGPLMVLGFVGTVIALERAVSLRAAWGYFAPALLGAGGMLLISPAPTDWGQLLLMLGCATLLLIYRRLWRRNEALPVLIECLGAFLAFGATLLWLGGAVVPQLAPWLVGFPVLTIVAERLELSTVGREPTSHRRAERLTAALAVGYVLSCALALVAPHPSYVLLGLLLLAMVTVVARADVAFATVRTRGLTRYMAVAMLAGYVWLTITGLIWLLTGGVWEGPGYDAALHAVFLGFVISMVMAHAPVIMPAVIRRPLPYSRAMYGPLLLLHVSLLVRVIVGHAWDVPVGVQIGGIGNIAAVLTFAGVAATQAVGARSDRRRGRAFSTTVGSTLTSAGDR